MNKYICTLFILFCFKLTFSQGIYENELTTNAVLMEYSSRASVKLGSITDTISLGPKGILDDFSYHSPYPDTSLWLDNFVFINRDYPRAPLTLGVATFDGLNEKGYPYNFQMASGASGLADYLTSKPIDLNYLPSDSVYLSFYYQPQGLGNAPEASDSLVLQFREAGAAKPWENQWSTKGKTLVTSDSSWKIIMIPIKETKYLKKGFQFRFKNYATLSGNVDHWHVDYVYLNKVRNQADTLFEDVAFVFNTPSLLNDYSMVPWRHYGSSMMKANYETTIRNNFTATKNTTFGYKIYDKNGAQLNTTYSGGSNNIDPFVTNGYSNYVPFALPTLNYTIPASLSDTTFYSIESFLNTTPDFNRNNDTVRHYQHFYNHYAYDDGTAETSYGLSTLYALMAQKFTIAQTDTVQAIDIFWNPMLVNVSSLYTFNLMIWNDAGGKPGTAIYTDTSNTPIYNQTGYNKFTRYYLSKGKPKLSAGTYYFGFRQNTNQFLNIGVDKNNNTQTKFFYNVTGSWANSPFEGSLMLRPVFGPVSDFVGIKEKPVSKAEIHLYPNPVNDKLFIKGLNNSNKNNIIIIDMFGKVIMEINDFNDSSIDVSNFSNGIYFLKIISEGTSITQKFVVTK